MAALGFVVGTGNLLGFPIECFKYGGGKSSTHMNFYRLIMLIDLIWIIYISLNESVAS